MENNDVAYDKESVLNSLKQAFARCNALSQRPHRISPSQRVELIKTMAYLSQVISSLEKELQARAVHKQVSTENNLRAFLCLQEDGIIEIKDMQKLKAILGCEEKEEANKSAREASVGEPGEGELTKADQN